MNLLIFNTESVGHYLEYTHHLYMYAYRHMPEDTITFVLPSSFRERIAYRKFPEQENLRMIFLTTEEMAVYVQRNSILWKSLHETSLLKKYIKLVKPDAVFLPSLAFYIPWIFCMGKKIPISGIEYRIPGWRAGKISFRTRMSDKLKLLIYAFSPSIRKVLLLNDKTYTDIYNKQFATSRFTFLPDPIVPICQNESISFPIPIQEFAGRKVFLHCGGMGERKGTFIILESIRLLPLEVRRKTVFIFAGKINKKDEILFKKSVEELSQSTKIYFIEGFLRFEEFAGLFQCADYVLVPYKNVLQSSGVIGYAAQFGKPVIGPAEGLLGNLITEYRLGYTLPQLNTSNLSSLIGELTQIDTHAIDGTSYLNRCTPENFAKIVFDSIKI